MPTKSGMSVCVAVVLAVLAAMDSAPVPAAAQAAAAKPTFDCAKATHEIELLICKDAALAALDVKMAGVYEKAMKSWPAETAKLQRGMQNGWIRGRNDCWKATDKRACAEGSYQDRIFEIQLAAGMLKAPAAASFACSGGDGQPVSVSFYNDAEPPSAILKVGQDKMTLRQAQSASGARYRSGDVEFWEHQGEATIDWFGTKLTCKGKK
jgi:uncharacterized protein